MDNFIIRWYNQNRKMFWTVILTIIGVIALIQTLNNYYENNPKKQSSSTYGTTTYSTNNYSVITQKDIDETISKKSINVIEEFFKYCNNGEIEDAYKILSTECREELYPTVEDFKVKYYNKIFTESKSYNYILWIAEGRRHTYRVEIMSDLLATGKKDDMPIEDYYTITSENGDYKLSISSYIGKEDINIYKNQKNISIKIISKKMYMDYEVYEIEVQNNTGNKLIFNTKENPNSVYIQDRNDLKYISFLNEIPSSELEILAGSAKVLEIKFNRGYKPTISIEKIIFGDIKINNNQQTESIEIEL